MSNRIYFKDESFNETSLVGNIKNRPTGLVAGWSVFSLILIGCGISCLSSSWFLLGIGFINLFCALFVFTQVKQYTAIRVYEDKLILTDHKKPDSGILVNNEEINSWKIESDEGSSLILDLNDGTRISYRIAQGGKVNRLLMKTVGNKEKNEKEMEQFRQKNDEAFIGIKDIKRLMKKRNDQDEKKY